MDYGSKIAQLRKEKGMTQAELGKQLSVTYQAVSKWERNESYPDFETMSKIAKLFGVPLSYFQDDAAEEVETKSKEDTSIDSILGVCSECGKMIKKGEEATTTPKIVCKRCVQLRKKKEEEERKANEQKEKAAREMEEYSFCRARNAGWIIASICATIFTAIVLAAFIYTKQDVGFIIGSAIGTAVVSITFVTQFCWNEYVRDWAFAGGKIVGTPGIIFTFDWDGFVFLIAMKILFAVIRFIIFLITAIIGLVFTMICSIFTFIPAIVRIHTRDYDMTDGFFYDTY
ncbi:MAG: helix-turn-helix transcriptional regulator [Clostridia bacterium]|nr:helix-turn-helix transcriptional regulator [Clostridia bacterium]